MVTGVQPWFANVDRWGSVCSIGTVLWAGWNYLHGILIPMPAAALFGGPGRLPTIIVIGGLAAAAHGVLWSLAEKAFRWNFGAGGNGPLPQGWSAVVLSLTQTVPLIAIPAAYQVVLQIPVVSSRHVVAGFSALLAALAGNLLMYGVNPRAFKGVRRTIAPVREHLTKKTGLSLEAIWSVVHFTSTAVVYRAVADAGGGSLAGVIGLPAWGALFFFGGMVSFIFLRPEALYERSWIQVRGVVAGVLLLVTLEGAMLA